MYGHIEHRFKTNIHSFRIEALGRTITKAVDIAELAKRNSKDTWKTDDFLEIEKVSAATEIGKDRNVSKISILLSKHSFMKAREFIEDLSRENEFRPIKIILLLKDKCKIDILKYLEIFSEDPVLKSYFRCLLVLLNSLKNRNELIKKIREERNRFIKIDNPEIHGFAKGIYDLYGVIDVIDSFLSVEDIEDMILLKRSIEAYFSKIESPEKYTRIIYDETIEISENIYRFRNAEEPYYKLYYLGDARFILEDIDSIVERHFVEPFKTMYCIILDKWRSILNESREKTRIKPKIKIITEHEPKPVDGILSIRMTLENVGFVDVEDAKLKIIENREFKVIDANPKRINIISPNHKSALHFKINMKKEKTVSVKYILGFKVQKRLFEKEDSFIIVPKGTHKEFNTTPNPYTFGRPLNPDKGDIFVGREDIFRFIEQNFKKPTKAMTFVIHGQRRTGKTSLLHYLPENVNVNKRFIYIDMQLRQEKIVFDYVIFSGIVIDRIIRLSGRNPFYLQGLCRLLVDHLNLKKSNYVMRLSHN